ARHSRPSPTPLAAAAPVSRAYLRPRCGPKRFGALQVRTATKRSRRRCAPRPLQRKSFEHVFNWDFRGAGKLLRHLRAEAARTAGEISQDLAAMDAGIFRP